jgi:hypothetical protein
MGISNVGYLAVSGDVPTILVVPGTANVTDFDTSWVMHFYFLKAIRTAMFFERYRQGDFLVFSSPRLNLGSSSQGDGRLGSKAGCR